MPSLYEIVYGPRDDRGASIDRALVANVVLARECALLGDTAGEADYHAAINELLDLRERETHT
jgi:hypothetical protein